MDAAPVDAAPVETAAVETAAVETAADSMAAYPMASAPPADSSGIGALVKTPHIQVRLISELVEVPPGQKFWVALRQQIIPNWHTYWRNPGDSGEPTDIDWNLPPDWEASAIHWPVPHRIPVGPLMNFGYSDEVWLLSELTAPEDLKVGQPVEIQANAYWLVCEEVCIPEEGNLTLTLKAGDRSLPGAHAQTIRFAESQLPGEFSGEIGYALSPDGLQLQFDNPLNANPIRVEYFPFLPDVVDHAAPQDVSQHGNRITLSVASRFAARQDNLAGLLVVGGHSGERDNVRGYRIQTGQISPLEPAPATQTRLHPGLVLLMALAGGMILNLMPCVFPVLSIKVLALVDLAAESRTSRTNTLIHGLVYGVGIISGFLMLAAILIALRAFGVAAGWGFQLQNPLIVLLLAWLFFVIGLNLAGKFEFGSGLSGAGEKLLKGGGMKQSFFTGLLATVVASPCTAPFMGVALGYAILQPGWIAMSIFAILGLGMAFPFILLCAFPGWLRRLPKPGPWMLRFKEILAIPMWLTSAWLVWVLVSQVGADAVLFASCGVLIIISLIWFNKLNRKYYRWFGQVCLSAMLIAAMFLLPPVRGDVEADQGNWLAFSEKRLADARREGPVFVNFTADWCITCKANEQVALHRAAVNQLFDEKGVALLKADWTRRDADIASALEKFGRSGVPLYLWYAGPEVEEPEILPQLLTEAMLLDRLTRLP